MSDEQPEPTEEEQEQAPDRLPDEDAMQYPGHDDPDGSSAHESDDA